MTRIYRARGVVRGTAEGEALVSERAFSFLGDVDLDTGVIVARGHPLEGESLAGRVMFYPETKGSSGGCIVLMTLAAAGKGPAAIVLGKAPDTNLVEGAIVTGTPLLAEPEEDLALYIRSGDRVAVNGASGEIRVL